MEAKDTVMTKEQIRNIPVNESNEPLEASTDIDSSHSTVAEAQAEISFKAGIKEVVELSDELLEIGRKAIEDTLVEWRDNRLSELNRGNGLVIREKGGEDSSIIRFGPETALRIGLKAMRQAKPKEWGIEQ